MCLHVVRLSVWVLTGSCTWGRSQVGSGGREGGQAVVGQVPALGSVLVELRRGLQAQRKKAV